MSERARKFVESWIEEYIPSGETGEGNSHTRSRADAVACVESALIEGISKDEIREEYPDLVSTIAARHREALAAEKTRPSD